MARDKNNEDITYLDQKIVNVDLEKEMKKSFIEYAMSVIVSRALPDVRDGFKPVHRRILYTMYEDNLTPDRAFRKSATTVGDVLGRYHPHGDASVYDALVRMAQDFSLRYPMVEGHGNFGSIDGDPPAAYRYTEARMSRISMEMLTNIDKDTVDFAPNYDNARKEPVVLPSRFPNLLVNGSSGIAVGMATNLPPHNLSEVIDAINCVIENPEADFEDLMEHIQGPDFPTAGIIAGVSGIRAAYATGRGKLRVRASAEIEETDNRTRIIVSELPYQVNKARLIESIANLVKDKNIEGISGLRDESDREGMRIVIELRRDANAQVVLNKLYKTTQMQTTFAIIMLALVDNQPKVLSLREIIDHYVAFQKQIIVRRTEYDLKQARARAHILEGLRIAIDNIDEIIRIIRESYNDAKTRLMERFGLSELQAQAILDMRLGRLQGLERDKIQDEYDQLMEKIRYLSEILGSESLVLQILKDELSAIKDKYGDERRTKIVPMEDDIDIEDLIEEEDCAFTLTHLGYIKRLPATTYRTQHRGGRGVSAQSVREEDFVETLFVASTHDYVLFFTNKGRLHRKKGYQIPEAGRTAKGMNIINLLPLEPEEKVTAMIPVKDFEEAQYLFMVTKRGTVKRILLDTLNTARKAGIRALTIDEDDELIAVHKTDGRQCIVIATRNGRAICFDENDVRPMGRDAMGVRGIRLGKDDHVIGAAIAQEGSTLLTITEKGYGKRTRIEEYIRGAADEDGEAESAAPEEEMSAFRPQRRGGKGLINYRITKKTGKAAAVKMVDESDDIMIITDDGTIIRMEASAINIYSRNTQGIILMRLAEEVHVISAAKTEKAEQEPEESSPEAEVTGRSSEPESTQE